jgi:hypothetical protein
MTKHAELFSCRGMTLRNTVVWALPVLVALWAPSRAEGSTPVVLSRLGDRVRVEVGGTLFTEYIFSGATRPYCYPVLAADGTSLVRDFPMKTTAGEDQDHPHHRALMFAHADVNKIDFWNEGTSGTAYPKGQIVHDAILEMKSGEVGVLRTKNSWRAPDGEVVATDNRTLRFQEKNGVRLLDFDVTLEARPDKPLTLGDNKDGTMAIRIAQWMTMPHRIRKQMVAGVGHIETARGDRDADAWGKRAPWCVYYAEYRGTTYGVALFDHPANLSHPTWWMARDYGLFAANPFGKRDFEKEQNHPAGIGDRTLAPGASLTLRYRFIFFQGRPESVGFERLFQQYSSAHP